MCSRYYVDYGTKQKICDLTGNPEALIRTGDIRPSEPAAILSGRGHALVAEDMTWGFPGHQGNGLLINARAETVTERPAFRDSVRSRRCVIPAKGFYEWNPAKERYQFEDPGETLFMAGCFDPQHRFVVITTEANGSVLPVHERMPLLIPEGEIETWIHETEAMAAMLCKTPQMLCGWTRYRQMTLFD